MNARELWSRILIIVGGIAMLVGALDPIEGSIVILPGSGLFAFGALLGQHERRLIAYRVWVFILIAVGVGAMWWGLPAIRRGFVGASGLSMWWEVLILPYLIGWSMGIWGPGSPRWLLLLGIAVGLWYQALLALNLSYGRGGTEALLVVSAIGVLTIVGCIWRLRNRSTER
jgi:hypothetical protein